MLVLSHLHQLFNVKTCHAYIHMLRWKDRPLQCPRCHSRAVRPWGHYHYLCSAIIVSAPSAGRPADNPHGVLCKTALDERLPGRDNSQGLSPHIAEGYLGDDTMHVPAPHRHAARVHTAETPR